MAIELATAYVSIVPETSGLDKKLTAAFNNAGRNAKITPQVDVKGVDQAGRNASAKLHDAFKSDAVRRGEKIGTAVGSVIGKGIGVGIKGAMGVAAGGLAAIVGGIGYSLTKGFERIKTIDQAKFKLKALGKTSSEVQAIMRTVTDSVTGTPFSLDAAFGTAVQAIGAGVTDIKGFMASVSDAAGFAGTDIDRMGLIFNQVLAKGKLTGEEMMQLMEAGLPAKSWIMDSYNLTSQQFEDMQRNGEITLQMLQDSVDKHAGGMSKKLGESLQGSLDNLKAAAGRTGASIITALSGGDTSNLTKGVDGFTEKLNNIDKWVKDHVPEIIRGVESIGTAFVNTATGALKLYKMLLKAQEAQTRLIGYTSITPDARSRAFADADRTKAEIESIDKEIEKNEERKKSWQEAQEAVAKAAQFTEDLQGALAERQGDNVVLKAPTADDLNKINEAKYRIEQIPGTKDFTVKARTEEAEAELTAWRDKQGQDPATVPADANPAPATERLGNWRTDEQGNPVRIPARVDTTQADADVNAFLEKWRSALSGGPGGSPPGVNPLMIPLQTGGTSPLPPGLKTPAGNSASFGGKQDSGGVMKPNAAETKRYYEGLGFQVGGYAPADSPEDEHQTGEATDIMVPSISAGNAVLPNALRRPGVQYVIWNNKMWYPDGSTKPYSGPSPHTDHLHVRQKANGGSITGPGGPKSDKIPAWLSNGEHVLTAEDVQAMGGQSGVYAFRSMLHGYSTGGAISTAFLNPDLPYFGRDKTDGSAGREREKDHKPANPEFGSDTQPGIRESLDGHRVRGPWGNVLTGAPWWFFPGDDKYQPGSPGARNRRDVLGFADGGAVGGAKKALELLRKNTSNLESVVHGKGNGVPVLPGPAPEEIQPPDAPVEAGRTEGYIPAAAGSTAKVGESPLAGIIGMGAEVINGLIDQAASAASTAAGAALAAGTMGAGAAGSPAAAAATDAAIGMATGAAKRGVQWGADMIGIVADSAVEQIFPFGAPRWLGSADPTAFMPQMDILSALTTTNEKGIAAAAQQSAVDPLTTQHGQAQGAAPGPVTPQALEGVGALAQAAEEATNWAAPPQPAMVHVENITAADSASVGASIAKQQRLEMMRFAGRP